MNNQETAPIIDKVLHADGSVKTMAGEVILPADPRRAEEYQNRAANTDKWLRSDGSVTDMSGRVILEADESRARDYASRSALAAVMLSGGGAGGSEVALIEYPASISTFIQNDLGNVAENLTPTGEIFNVSESAVVSNS